MAVANRGLDIMSAETCRRFNGKQQCRRRSGKCVQLRDWFMVRHSSSRHVCMYTYYHVRPNTSGESKKHPPKVKSRDGHICGTCVQNFRSISYKKSWTYRLLYGKHAYFRWLLQITWFYSRIEFLRYVPLNIYHTIIGRWMFARNLIRMDRPWSTCSHLVQLKMGNKVFPTETRHHFWPWWWPVVGGDTFSSLAPILGPI